MSAVHKVFDDYQKKVVRFGHELGHRDNIAHAVCGMLGEVGELRALSHLTPGSEFDALALVEELGDCWWYAAWYATSQDRSFSDAVFMSINLPPQELSDFREALDHLEMAGCAMLDQVKKVLFYGREDYDQQLLNEEYLTYLRVLYQATLITQSFHQYTIGSILEANFKKLDTRYPAGEFTSGHALNRNTQAEYQAMGAEEVTDGC
jgi:hypothetical protein